MLFTNAQKAMADQIAENNVNLNNFKFWAQYWTATTYTDEANYDLINRNIPDNVYRAWYRDVLRDLKEAKTYIAASVAVGDEEIEAKNNKLQIIEILEVYSFQRLVDIFGNIPYSQALDIDATLNPVYDDPQTIYADLVKRLDAAVAALSGSASFGNQDIFYHGDVEAWKTFAYSLKFRMGVTLAEAGGQNWAEAAAANTFTDNTQSAQLVYEASPLDNTNPLYQNLVASGRNDYVAANTIIDAMNLLEDPRRPVYFDKHEMDEYVGGQYGFSSSYETHAHIGPMMHDPTFPATILSYIEIEWMKAEAASRGWNVGGTAAEHYANAIRASFEYWGVDGVEDYLAKPEVDFAQASVAEGSELNAIAKQAWIGLYERGFEAWTTHRRLDYPELNVPENALTTDGKTPRRFTYPVTEQTLNKDNYYNAADAVGGDAMETRLFWDKR
jgi:hypothetical protein